MQTLRQGSRGADVQLLQTALSRAGFYRGSIDGIFGQNTENAVISFQQGASLDADGIVGAKTWNALLPYIRGYVTHTIRRGDTFWGIAEMHGTTVRAIATANPELDPQNLRIGQDITVPLGFPVVPTNINYTSHLTGYIVEGLKARYPFLKTGSTGSSVTGKSIYFVRIGVGRTEVFYNASHHANEWITTPLLLKYLESYALEYSRGGRISGVPASYLYGRTSLYVVPLVNPDGVDLVNGALTDGPYFDRAREYAGNYPQISFPSGWKANISGVDLNLQYPAEWETAREIKFAQGFTSPAPRDFVGSAPLVAPESRAVYDFTLNRDFSLILAYHTQGEIIYWRFLDYLPPRSREIADKMSDVSGYSVEETPRASGYAGYKDWFIQQYDRPGYTIEAGRGVNPLPLSQFDRMYEDNEGILTVGMLEA